MDDRIKKLEADVAYWKRRALAQAKRLDAMPRRSFVALEVKCKSRRKYVVDTSFCRDPRDGVRELNALNTLYTALNASLDEAEGGKVEARELPVI